MIRSRIAPTPSGYLHIGNALNFVRIWLWVRKVNGSLRLRIDDLDTPRAKREYIEDIFYTLEWMGMDWDEGPQNINQEHGTYSQVLRARRYDELIEKLIETEKVYACVCSRKGMSADICNCADKGLPYDTPNTSLHIKTISAPVTINDLKRGAVGINPDKEIKDFVIRRRDGIVAYQVASLADDMDYGTNLILRGEDLLSSTAAQIYLASLIGDRTFAQTSFYHHPLLYDLKGAKLSKSAGSASLKAMRENNPDVSKLYMEISKLLGWPVTCTSLSEMLAYVKENDVAIL